MMVRGIPTYSCWEKKGVDVGIIDSTHTVVWMGMEKRAIMIGGWFGVSTDMMPLTSIVHIPNHCSHKMVKIDHSYNYIYNKNYASRKVKTTHNLGSLVKKHL